MGLFDRLRRPRPEEATPSKKGEVVDIKDYFSSGVKKDPAAQGIRPMPKTETGAGERQDVRAEVEKPSPVAEAKHDVFETYKSEIASFRPETIARSRDLQGRIVEMEESLFDFFAEVLDAETLSEADKKDVEDVRQLSEKFLGMVEPIAAGGIGGKDIRVRADALRQTFQNVEKKLS